MLDFIRTSIVKEPWKPFIAGHNALFLTLTLKRNISS